MTRAVVVGSGPNGLTAAVLLARAGLAVTVLEAADTIGGGTRTSELTVPGVLHDHCSASHPLAVASPALRGLGLERHGLEWRWAPTELAHPLDGGRAAVLERSLEQTATALRADGDAWRRLFGPLVRDFDALIDDVLRPPLHVPRHPVTLARFAARAPASATRLARRFAGDEARALFAGLAAHVYRPLGVPATGLVGLLLGTAGHRRGWPVARGGSRAITDALAAELQAWGGRVETGRRVASLGEVDDADIVLLDVSPLAMATIGGSRLPARARRAYRRYRYGPAAFKLDLAVEGGVPWTNAAVQRAGVVHVGGSLEQIAAAERAVAAGRMPQRPFVLVAQQYLADPGRSAGHVHPVWAYAHVPHDYDGDASEAIIAALERFAPGVRERIVGQATRGPREFEAYDANYVGGDISCGANDPWQLVMRPRLARDPYATGIPGIYLCSSATPPGAGVHGMCGANAAASALRDLAR